MGSRPTYVYACFCRNEAYPLVLVFSTVGECALTQTVVWSHLRPISKNMRAADVPNSLCIYTEPSDQSFLCTSLYSVS